MFNDQNSIRPDLLAACVDQARINRRSTLNIPTPTPDILSLRSQMYARLVIPPSEATLQCHLGERSLVVGWYWSMGVNDKLDHEM